MALVYDFSSATEKILCRCRVVGVVWSGATAAGDDVIVKAIQGGRIWGGRASGTDTYQGIWFNEDRGILAHHGIEFEALDSGRVYIYVGED